MRVSLCFIVVFLLLSCSNNNKLLKQQEQNVNISRTVGYKFINPLLDCGIEFKEINPFALKIRHYVNKKINDGEADMISVYFRHLKNGYWFGINENEKFNPASTMKVPIMMEFLKIAEIEPKILKELLLFDKIYGDCTYFEEDSLVLGNKYPPLELLERMITNSDNYATGILYRFNRSYTNPQRLFSELMVNRGIDNPYDSISVKDYSGFFRILYNSSFLSKEYSEYALNLLCKTKFKYALVRGVADTTIEIAHKYGEYITDTKYQLHDCGIVYYPNNPYLLCIMTKGNDERPTRMDTIIADISKMVYQEVDKQLKK